MIYAYVRCMHAYRCSLVWKEALAKFGTATASKKRVARVEALPVVVVQVEHPPSRPGSSGLVCYLFVSL